MKIVITFILLVLNVTIVKGQDVKKMETYVSCTFYDNHRFVMKIQTDPSNNSYLMSLVGSFENKDETITLISDTNYMIIGTQISLSAIDTLHPNLFQVKIRLISEVTLYEGMEPYDLLFDTIKYSVNDQNFLYSRPEPSDKNEWVFTKSVESFAFSLFYPKAVDDSLFGLRNFQVNSLQYNSLEVNYKLIYSNVTPEMVQELLPTTIEYEGKTYRTKFIRSN